MDRSFETGPVPRCHKVPKVARNKLNRKILRGMWRRPWEQISKISDFHENLGFLKIREFRENLGFSRKSRIFAKILDFRENLGFSWKSWIFVKILHFRENLGFSRKLQNFVKISDFRENLGFSRKSWNFCSLAPRIFKLTSHSHIFAQSATSCGVSSNVMYNKCGGPYAQFPQIHEVRDVWFR